MRIVKLKSAILIVPFILATNLWPQEADDPHPASLVPSVFINNLAQDQRHLWSSPFKARIQDLNWIVPIAGLTAGLINADSELSSRISNTNTLAKRSSTLSNAALATILGASGGLYLLGRWHGDDHQRETGILSGEAAINALLIDEVFKLATRREFPTDDSGKGRFGRRNTLNSSFPSGHAIVAWSVASLLTHEYPGPLTKLLAYGLATGVSVTRVTGKKHFPSDVVVGSAMGWLIGREVYARHHNPELGGTGFGTFHSSPELGEERSTESIASPYVPLDSWIYPAFDRLAALGVAPSAMAGMKPWTRRECARILEEASGYLEDSAPSEASRLYAVLAKEFAPELSGSEKNYAGIDSVYARVTPISGQPLTDGYHFGQTIVNDYGRPYQRGANYLTGFSSSSSIGALGFYVRGEFEHAPSAPALSQAVTNAIQLADAKPAVLPAEPIASFNRFRLLDSYLMLNINGWQASFGKQSLWLGPTQDPFLFSNNAEPIYMLRLSQTSPRKLPGFLDRLGPYRIELFVGKLTGQHFVNTQDGNIAVSVDRTLARQPMINGQKITFKPTPNFEFGVGRTGLWGGPNFPITLGTTKNSLFATTNAIGRDKDPGDRRSTFDFSYRIPGLRKWLVIYDDSFTEDEISPIGYPQQSAHNPGIYMPQIPKLPKLDFRFEAAYTNLQDFLQPAGGGFFYWNVRYLDGYTNKGNIMGNATVGRQGIAFRAASTWWFASDKTVQLGYRTEEADHDFLQGGSLRDLQLRSDWSFNQGVSLSSFLQYEWWNWPLLSAGNRRNNFAASLQLTYWPHWRLGSGK
ncbi:MAG TPA: capsule assembly Wzi family protein [Candidatus Angelobacter sp.]|nr:capsule assembly Wzi family protein [Candidatus Angelobacter sp.]